MCGAASTNEGHLFWECPIVLQSKDVTIQKTNRYCSESHRTGLDQKCYWWRGLQPVKIQCPSTNQRHHTSWLGHPLNNSMGRTLPSTQMARGADLPLTSLCVDAVGHGSAQNQVPTKRCCMEPGGQWQGSRQFQGLNSLPSSTA